MTDPGEPSPRIDNAIDRIVRAVEFVAQLDDPLRAVLQGERVEGNTVFKEPTTVSETEELAAQARAHIGLDDLEPAFNLSSKLVGAGVLTFVVDLGTESADAASVLLPSGAVAVVNGSLRTGRRRLALAHEFGHVLIADEYTVDWRVDTSTSDVRERGIDRFARALLLPRHALETAWRRWGGASSDTIRTAAVRTASHFRVDMSTLARRLQELDLIDKRVAALVRTTRTTRADIVEHDLVVADELQSVELPREYEASVLRLYMSEVVSEARALDLLLDSWDAGDLSPLEPRTGSEIWQFVS